MNRQGVGYSWAFQTSDANIMSRMLLASARRWRSLAWERPVSTGRQWVAETLGASIAPLKLAEPAPLISSADGASLRLKGLEPKLALGPAVPATSSRALEVTGLVRRVRYQSAETGYTVLQLLLDESERRRKEVVTVVGHLAKVSEGQRLRVVGDWTMHPQYGRQMLASEVHPVEPESEDELVQYISSGVLPGVGPVTAKALVNTFGSTLQEVLNGPDAERLLHQCPGIGPSKARSIKRGWDEAHGSRAGFVFARNLGLPAVQAQALADQHGQQLETALRADPYSMLQPLNMPLGKMDAVVSRLDANKYVNLESRQAAAMRSCLVGAAASDGHSYLPWSVLRGAAIAALRGSHTSARSAMDDLEAMLERTAVGMAARGDLVVVTDQIDEDIKATGPPKIRLADDALCYDPALAAAERLVTEQLAKRAQRDAARRLNESDDWVDGWFMRWHPKKSRVGESQQKKTNIISMAPNDGDGSMQPTFTQQTTSLMAPLPRRSSSSNLLFQLSEGQKSALRLAAHARVSALTGGPGCGKTSTLGAIVALWRAQGKRVRVCAPTGRAAQRLGAALREHGGPLARAVQPMTVHRLLRWQPKLDGNAKKVMATNHRSNKRPPGAVSSTTTPLPDTDDGSLLSFEHNATNPLEADAVLVDEASMLSLPLAAALLDALPPNCQLVLVGDADQLPSVGPGAVLAATLRSRVVPAVDLRRVFRQAAGSAIVAAARSVRDGHVPTHTTLTTLKTPSDLTHFVRFAQHGDAAVIRAGGSDAALRALSTAVRALSASRGWGRDDVQVISPTRIGPLGTNVLNSLLQDLLNNGVIDAGEHVSSKETRARSLVDTTITMTGIETPILNHQAGQQQHAFRTNDRVMQLVNDYDREVFNGDQGIVVSHDAMRRELVIDFPHLAAEGDQSSLRTYQGAEINALGLAYAVTVHKAQGGEAPCVILMLSPSHARLLDRRLLYTGITRARELLIIIEVGAKEDGTGGPIARAVARAEATMRYSGLDRRWAAKLPRHEPQVFEGVEPKLAGQDGGKERGSQIDRNMPNEASGRAVATTPPF